MEDRLGRLIDGNHDGQTGGNAVALLGRSGVTLAAVDDRTAVARPVIQPSAVDALLERESAIGWSGSVPSAQSTHRKMAR
jgi:hypothetical protein